MPRPWREGLFHCEAVCRVGVWIATRSSTLVWIRRTGAPLLEAARRAAETAASAAVLRQMASVAADDDFVQAFAVLCSSMVRVTPRKSCSPSPCAGSRR